MIITKEHLEKSMSYSQYSKLLHDLMEQGKTTGPNQSEEYLDYTKLNLQRMTRLDKTTELIPALKSALAGVRSPYTWLVLTEGWCGDAAQNLPVLHAVEKECLAIAVRLLLRDENLDIMDQYLTHGSRSIPKLICLQQDLSLNAGSKEIFTWGPRPEGAQNLMLELKKNNTPHDERSLHIQKWYNTDKTLSTQKEILNLVSRLH
jgi:hypothetical protein